MKLWSKITIVFSAFAITALPLRAQEAVPPPTPAYQVLGTADLDRLLGPIALYPDPLIAQILPAATLPAQIVLADRYVINGGDPNQIDQQPWDASVQALARYPQLLKWMDDNLGWTTELGQAFLNQQQEVMESIQRLRQSAVNLGNLQSTPQQQVVNDGTIEIVPADPQVIYVPVYQPAQVYYQRCYGPSFISFGVGFAIGYWLNCDFDWHNHNIVVWNRAHPRPLNWWHEPPRQRNYNHIIVWHPNYQNYHPGMGGINRGDRGWNVRPNQPIVVSRSISDSAAPRRTPTPGVRPATPAPWPGTAPGHPPLNRLTSASNAGNYALINQPSSNGALIGIQSSQDTRDYSNRGRQSVGTMPHSAPATRPPAGGGRNSNPRR